MSENKASTKIPRRAPIAPRFPRHAVCGNRDGALERYAVTHGLNMDQVRLEMERCLAEGASLRRFFEPD